MSDKVWRRNIDTFARLGEPFDLERRPAGLPFSGLSLANCHSSSNLGVLRGTRVRRSTAHARAFCTFVRPSVRLSVRPSIRPASSFAATLARTKSLRVLRARRYRIWQFARIRVYMWEQLSAPYACAVALFQENQTFNSQRFSDFHARRIPSAEVTSLLTSVKPTHPT